MAKKKRAKNDVGPGGQADAPPLPPGVKLLRTLEGHTGLIEFAVFSHNGRLLASKSRDQTIRLWSCETWETVAVIPEPTYSRLWIPTLAFHPTLALLAAAGSEPDSPDHERSRLIHP